MDGLKIALSAGPHDCVWTPVRCELNGADATAPGADRKYAVQDETGLRYPAQVEIAGERAGVVFVVPYLKAGETRHLSLVPIDQSPDGVAFDDSPGESVEVRVHGRPFTRYLYGKDWARPFLYPVIGPAGTAVTRNFPMRDDVQGEKRDHPHHKSIFFTHGDVNGVDNWSEQAGHGRTRHQAFVRLEGGPVFGDLWAENLWVDTQERPIVRQETRLRFYALPDHVRIFDAEVAFDAAYGDVVFGDTKEGGLISVRVASTMDASGAGQIETATGAIGEEESWGRPASWCHYSGPVQSAFGPIRAGIGVIDHPSNPRYPTHWHVRNYGLMTANPFGLSYYYKGEGRDGSLRIGAGERGAFRYRVVIHEGDAEAGRMTEHFLAFANPPAANVSE